MKELIGLNINKRTVAKMILRLIFQIDE